jgi:hypothetical protein
VLSNRELREEALRIVTAADEAGVPVRLAGSAAVLVRSPSAERLYERAGRRVLDVDVVTVSRVKTDTIDKLLGGLGYRPLAHHNIWHVETRQMFERPDGLHVDVFRDVLDFCHPIALKARLEHDHPTIPLAELLLAKLQIVDITEKDLQDVAVLLLDRALGGGRDEVDAGFIARTLAGDWGFWYTATANLGKARGYAESLDAAEREIVTGRLSALERRIEEEPKGSRWKLRARIGTKRRWYQEVEEAQR